MEWILYFKSNQLYRVHVKGKKKDGILPAARRGKIDATPQRRHIKIHRDDKTTIYLALNQRSETQL